MTEEVTLSEEVGAVLADGLNVFQFAQHCYG